MVGLYPGHMVEFNFEKEGEEGEGGRRQLVVGKLLARTYTDAMYTAMVWESEQNAPIYGLVRAPTVVSPARWGSGKVEDPNLGTISPQAVLTKLMPYPVFTAAVRILLPDNHSQAFAQCYNHITSPLSALRNLRAESFLPPHLFPATPRLVL